MKIVVTNAVVTNTGDAAIFAGIRASLIADGVATEEEITLLDSNARRTKALYPEWRILQQMTVGAPVRPSIITRAVSAAKLWFARRLSTGAAWATWSVASPLRRTSVGRAYAAIRDADAVISTGGTYLVDHYDFEFRAVELETAHRLGKPVILWTQSMGPFEDERARTSIQRIIACTSHAYLRDDESRDAWIAAGGASERAYVVPDVAFAIDVDRNAYLRRSRAVISVREWGHKGPSGESFNDRRYAAAMRSAGALCTQLFDETIAVSTCQGVRGYHDDSKKALEVFEGTPVEVNRDFHTPGGLLTTVGESEIVITTRMHLAILSLIAGTPTIAIAYEFKTLALFRSLGLEHFVVSIADVNDEWLEGAIRRVQKDPSSAILDIEDARRLRKKAMLPASMISR